MRKFKVKKFNDEVLVEAEEVLFHDGGVPAFINEFGVVRAFAPQAWVEVQEVVDS